MNGKHNAGRRFAAPGMTTNVRVATLARISATVLAVLAACGGARADDSFWDEIARYWQRIDTVTIASGDAKEVNAVTHIIDPWPSYVRNRRIDVSGARLVSAMKRYRNPRSLPNPLPTLEHPITPQLGVGHGGGASGAGGGAAGGSGGAGD